MNKMIIIYNVDQRRAQFCFSYFYPRYACVDFYGITSSIYMYTLKHLLCMSQTGLDICHVKIPGLQDTLFRKFKIDFHKKI